MLIFVNLAGVFIVDDAQQKILNIRFAQYRVGNVDIGAVVLAET